MLFELDGDEDIQREPSQTWDKGDTVQPMEDNLPLKISGRPHFQRKLRAILTHYSEIFSKSLHPEPADVPPLELTVDKSAWECRQNVGAARLQSETRSREIARQCQQMMELNLISKSTTPWHSQVHLVPKPNSTKWRFTIDFRRLNAATASIVNWPIPNIKEMLGRLGHKRLLCEV
jgi:hypothetical protein